MSSVGKMYLACALLNNALTAYNMTTKPESFLVWTPVHCSIIFFEINFLKQDLSQAHRAEVKAILNKHKFI